MIFILEKESVERYNILVDTIPLHLESTFLTIDVDIPIERGSFRARLRRLD